MAALNITLSLSGLQTQRGQSLISLIVILAVCLLSRVTEAQFGGGTGTPDDPYLIFTDGQLNEIGADSQNLDKHFKLMKNIDLSGYTGTDFNIIGTSWNNHFSGVFDGYGKRFHNFTYTSEDMDYIGLFGFVRGENALIKNLGLIDAHINAGEGDNVGSLVGQFDKGAAVRGCYARGGSVSGNNDVGGLVGHVSEGSITYCYSTASVSGRSDVGGLAGSYYVHVFPNVDPMASPYMISYCYATGSVSARISAGGLVGHNWDGTITSCYSTGNVSGTNEDSGWRLGGLIGYNHPGTIANCYSTGDVSGFFEVGGLIGGNRDGTITNCYSTGGVIGTREVGGLVGRNSDGTFSNSFWDSQRSGLNNMCGEQSTGTGCDDGNGRTTAQMQMGGTFLEVGWDFVSETENGNEDLWTIREGLNCPQLYWQFITGDFDGDNKVNFVDFAFFAQRWLSSDSGFLFSRGADLTNDEKVGLDDLIEFADNWLTEGIPISTAVLCLTIDDFESYNDLDPGDPESNRIFDVWLDGYDNLLINGCIVGNNNPPYAERDIVYGGEQSMPFYYNALFRLAKAELILSPPQNWAETGAEVLSLWFHGDSINGVTPMSVVINGGAAVYHNDPETTRINTWTEWIINLQEFVGVDLANVSSIAICLGDQSKPQAGGTGKMFFDNIRLYEPG